MVSDPESLRAAFAAHLGDERYTKFIFELDKCRSLARLRHWMQEAWDAFARAHPGWELTFPELLSVFRVCRVHKCQLTPAAVRLEASVEFTDEYYQAWSRVFPHSYPTLPDDFPHPTRVVDTFLCRVCQAARDEWEKADTIPMRIHQRQPG